MLVRFFFFYQGSAVKDRFKHRDATHFRLVHNLNDLVKNCSAQSHVLANFMRRVFLFFLYVCIYVIVAFCVCVLFFFNQFSSFQSLDWWLIESSVERDRKFSRNFLQACCTAGGHCGQFWHGQGCPIFDFVPPAFPLPTIALPTLQGALKRQFLKRLSW